MLDKLISVDEKIGSELAVHDFAADEAVDQLMAQGAEDDKVFEYCKLIRDYSDYTSLNTALVSKYGEGDITTRILAVFSSNWV